MAKTPSVQQQARRADLLARNRQKSESNKHILASKRAADMTPKERVATHRNGVNIKTGEKLKVSQATMDKYKAMEEKAQERRHKASLKRARTSRNKEAANNHADTCVAAAKQHGEKSIAYPVLLEAARLLRALSK